ncbi:MAG TPA: hypothetical protein VHT49_08980 [Acidimicrobiales bacterium]|nr:hypothetical protein [Acidimicrobiales bacterium]
MKSSRPRRQAAHQPELPLAGTQPGESTPPKAGPPEWRLDERTRLVGRQGIAAARALLAAHDPTRQGPDGTGNRRQSGRAA